MDIFLKPDIEKLIEDELRSGRSADPSDFLNKAAAYFFQARDQGQELGREEVEEKIARGLAEAERGETIDGEEAFRQLRAHAAELRRQRA
jgi:predicted transcriptional regulator